MRTAYVGSVSDHRAENGNRQVPRVPLPDVGVTFIRETCTVSCEDITPRSWLLQTHSSIPLGSPLLRPKPRSWSLCRLRPATAARRDLPDVISVNPSLGAWAPVMAVPRSARACFFLHVIGLPLFTIKVGFPHCSRRNDFMTDRFFETAAILYVQALRFVRLPDRSYRCDLSPQDSRGFYVRAEHASLPPHASDMPTTRPGNWWCGDLHPTRFTALSAAPAK